MSAVGGATAANDESITAEALCRRFDGRQPFTIGLEEEVLVLDALSHAPLPLAGEVVDEAAHSGVKRELPACQLELMTDVHRDPESAIAELSELRRRVRAACGSTLVVAPAAVHPVFAIDAVSDDDERHRAIVQEYGEVARRQVVGSLQVHVAVGSASATLPVYNAMRNALPELAALCSAAPFHEGRDTGFASVRPIISGQLPRQGVPPVIPSWEMFAAELAWGAASGTVAEPRRWWWELRPHPLHGTIEVRVPDVQARLDAAAAVAEVVHALVRSLADRYERGDDLPAAPTWRIAENRWQALRDGVHGNLADLETGDAVPTRRRLHTLLDELEPHAVGTLDRARPLVEHNGADDLRAVGLERATHRLVDEYAP